MNKSFSIITESNIKKITDKNPKTIYESVKQAYLLHSKKKTVNPPSYFMNFPDKEKSRIIALPAAIMEEPRISGLKWISSNPDNIKHNLKRASAVIILNNYETGYPIACLEAGVISALRTVYSAILVVDSLLQGKSINKLGVIGAGNISYEFLRCLILLSKHVHSVQIYDINPEYSNTLKFKIVNINPNIKIEVKHEFNEVIKESDLILFATTTQEPYIHEASLFKHKPIILNLSLRDLGPEIIISANNIVDDIDHVLNANTSPHLAEQKYQHRNFINCTIGELLNGHQKLDFKKPIIISPMGMGLLDIAVAYYVYLEAQNKNLATNIEGFFS